MSLLARIVVGILLIGEMILVTGIASGQEYPTKPIRIAISAPGGSSDFGARIIAAGITGPLGQQVIVDPRGSAVAAGDAGRNAPPDGYTIMVNGGSLWILPLLQKMPYDVIRDYVPITQISREVNVLVVHPALPVKSVKELIALAKARPGELNYGSGGTGTASHLAGELFNQMADVKLVRIGYKGLAQALTDLISGEVQVMIIDAGQVAPHVKTGRLKALAVTTADPSALAPGMPTVSASGLPGYESVGISGIWAPAKTPTVIINRLNHEIVRVLNQTDVKEKFFNAGVEVVASSPEQFADMIKADLGRMSKVVKNAGIKGD